MDSLNDKKDFDVVRNAMRVLGYTADEIETVWKLLASILHLVKIINNIKKQQRTNRCELPKHYYCEN